MFKNLTPIHQLSTSQQRVLSFARIVDWTRSDLEEFFRDAFDCYLSQASTAICHQAIRDLIALRSFKKWKGVR